MAIFASAVEGFLKQFLPKAPPRFAIRGAIALHQALIRAAELVIPARFVLTSYASAVARTGLVGAAAGLRFADHLADGPLTGAELAARSGANADAVHRTMRALVSLGIFALGRDGRFRNNRLSEPLRAGVPGSAHASAVYWASASNVRAWGDFTRTVQTGESAFERVHEMDVWQWFAEHPDEAQAFNGFMQALTSDVAPMLVAGYSFEGIERLCDVAGGRGTLLAGVLAAQPSLRGMLVDSASVLEEARSFLAERGLTDRVELSPGSFFDRVPAGADAYMLKDVLHDWDDERAVQILRNVRRATPVGGRVLVVELKLELEDTEHPGPLVDVQMMTVCGNGRQRSEEDFRRLFALADYRLTRITPLAIPHSVIEGVAV